jgi:hypothetical protein
MISNPVFGKFLEYANYLFQGLWPRDARVDGKLDQCECFYCFFQRVRVELGSYTEIVDFMRTAAPDPKVDFEELYRSGGPTGVTVSQG